MNHMKKLFRTRLSFWLIVFSYLATNILFNFYFWQQLILKELPHRIGVFGEWPIYEYIAEIVRQNIISGKNPFSEVGFVLYPFGWNFALEDMAPINGFYYLFLRTFLTVNKSFVLIMLLSIFASNLSMYLLLQYIKVSRKTAFVMGLIFGYTPFLVIRLGHPTYLALYLFPLFFLLAFAVKETEHRIKKLIYAVVFGVVCVISVLTNLYYTFMIILLCLFFFLFFLISDRRKLLVWMYQLFPSVFVSFAVAGLLLFPWLIKIYESFSFSQRVYAPSLVDSVSYSADLVSIFLPGSASPIYGKFIQFITTFYITFMKPSFENFIYPGLFILGVYFYFIFYKKKITRSALKKAQPFFIISIIFWILTLGPFLHILGKKLPIPLPYLVLHITPYLNMARSPGRFIVPFVFLSTIVAAFVIDDIFKNKLKITIAKNLFFLNLLLIFFLDQSYIAVLPSPYFRVIPPKIYNYLQSYGQGVLLEVPFTVRDGLRFQGNYHTVWLPFTQLIHRQKIFSVYGGRIRDDIFDYYKNDPLLGYIDKLINKLEIGNDTFTEKKKKEIIRSIDFFDIQYVLLKTDELYSKTAHNLFSKIGFQNIMDDQGYLLLYKKMKEYSLTPSKIIQANKKSDLYLAEGWSRGEPTGRWVVGKKALILFKINQIEPIKIKFSAYSLAKNQKMQIYINKKKINEMVISQDLKTYSLEINRHLTKGINRLVFKFSDSVKPARIITKSLDKRDLSMFFNTISFHYLNNDY